MLEVSGSVEVLPAPETPREDASEAVPPEAWGFCFFEALKSLPMALLIEEILHQLIDILIVYPNFLKGLFCFPRWRRNFLQQQ